MINKKTIIAMMLALVGMAGQAKVYKSIKSPEVMVQADVLMGELKIDEVMKTDTVSADTTIILNYGGMMDVDTITISKSSATFKQLQEAEAVIQGLTEQYANNRAILNYVLSHPDSDGSVYLLNHVQGMSNGKKILSSISERVRNGNMKKLYDAFDAGIKEFDSMTAKTRIAIPIGEEAKDFTLEDINGQQLTLSSLRGRYVMIDFWGSWCVNCIAAFPDIKQFYEEHRDKLEILGVAIHDKKEAWKKAAEKNELPWRQVLDTEGEGSVAELYGIVAAPTYVLIDPAGKVIEWSIGEHEAIREHFLQ